MKFKFKRILPLGVGLTSILFVSVLNNFASDLNSYHSEYVMNYKTEIPVTFVPTSIITIDDNLDFHYHFAGDKRSYDYNAAKSIVDEFFSNNNLDINNFIQDNNFADYPIEPEFQEMKDYVKSNYPSYKYKTTIISPEVEAGMIIYYDGMGNLTKAVDKNNNILDTLKNELVDVTYPEGYTGPRIEIEPTYNEDGTYTWGSSNNTLTISNEGKQGLSEGVVTQYSGVGLVGADGGSVDGKLGITDCATPMNYSRPPAGTPVYLRNLTTDHAEYVYKWDVGRLPDAIIDIQWQQMENEYGVPTGPNHTYGSFKGRAFYSY